MITGVAMMIDGKLQSLPKPNRHGDIIRKYPMPDYKHGTQGFVDNHGLFFDRKAAFLIATAAGQLEGRVKTSPKDILFSEDLW